MRRLQGPYPPHEAAAQTAPERKDWLRPDLDGLSPSDQACQAIPLCDHMPMLDSAERRFGALYVVIGSTLGGGGVADSRQFFQG